MLCPQGYGIDPASDWHARLSALTVAYGTLTTLPHWFRTHLPAVAGVPRSGAARQQFDARGFSQPSRTALEAIAQSSLSALPHTMRTNAQLRQRPPMGAGAAQNTRM
jgi:hypothetical protein